MKTVRRISTILIGFVFFLAGILKLMDPVGAGLVVDEYYKFFHLRFLSFSSEGVAFFLALLETLVGAALITGVWRRLTAMITALILGVFTIITLILWIFNPSMDCGCFGEAIHLTHFQSFLKNIVLCLLWLLAFLPFSAFGKPRKLKYVSFGVTVLSVLAFSIYSLCGIPLLDFTPFYPGSELMSASAPGEDPALLTFSDADGQYCDSLALGPRVAVFSVYNMKKVSPAAWDKLYASAKQAEEAGFFPLVLLASTPSSFANGSLAAEMGDYAYFADRRELLTLNRSNGGVTIISDAQIIAKWPSHGVRDWIGLSFSNSSEAMEYMMTRESSRKMKMQGFLLYVFAVMLLL